MQRKIFYFLLLLVLCPMLVFAGTRGKIRGKVVDLQTSEALIGANVIVVGTSYGANTDAAGEYQIPNLEAGTYTLKVSYIGYQSVTVSNVRINADLTSYQDFELPSEDIQVQTVNIVAKKPLVQKDNTNAVRVTTNEDIEALPIRGVNAIINLTPGTARYGDDLIIRGGRSDEVGFYLDGVSVKSIVGSGSVVNFSQDALEEIQVQSGGYSAEFGGANAGIVRQQLKSGKERYEFSYEYITDNIGFKSTEGLFDGKKTLGAYSWGYNEQTFNAGGPIPGTDNKVKFFANLNYQFRRGGANWNEPVNVGLIADPSSRDTVNFNFAGGPYRNTIAQSYNVATTLNFDLRPFIVRLSGTYSWRPGTNGGNNSLTSTYQTRTGTANGWDGMVSAKITHTLGTNLYYELNAGYLFYGTENYDQALGKDPWVYGDSVANAAAGYTWKRSYNNINSWRSAGLKAADTRYFAQSNYSIWGLGFVRDGSLPSGVSWTNRSQLSFNGKLVYLIGKIHTIQLGGSYEQSAIRNYAAAGTADLANKLYSQLLKSKPNATADEITEFKRANQVNAGLTNFGYDVFGNEYNGDGFYRPMKPVNASAFIMDKIEYEDIILNLGLRFDYFDADGWELTDPTDPDAAFAYKNLELFEKGWKRTETFSSISPRVGFAFPVTEKTVFHAEWGKFIQMPALNQMYAGLHNFANNVRGGFFISNPTAFGFKPTKTTNYELGFTQAIGDFMSIGVSGYYRDITDQLTYQKVVVKKTSQYSDYATFRNGDYATTKGLEITARARFDRLLVNGNISFQDARGTGSNPSSNAGVVGAPIEGITYTPQYISNLAFEYPMRGNLNIDYRFGNEMDIPSFLRELGASALIRFSSGHPYTLGTGGLNAETDARFRSPLEALNTSLTPNQFYLDMRIDKSFKIMDKLSANIYVFVINLLNIQNETDVHLKTGTASDDGDINNPDVVSKNIANYGQKYRDAELAIYEYNNYGFYSGPRQIRLGLRLEFR